MRIRRDKVERLLDWIKAWYLPGESGLNAELAELNKPLTGFRTFCKEPREDP